MLARQDRLGIRTRPRGSPLMHQRWEDLLFLHWPMPSSLLRPLVPEPLALDTFHGTAWIGVTPFSLSGLRPVSLPAVPGLSSFHELNVRTYVHYKGVPGLWFLTLYASKTLPVLGARWLFSLPYRLASFELRQIGSTTQYRLKRGSSPNADFFAQWQVKHELPPAPVETLEFFLTERYCLYAADSGRLYRGRVYHTPWLVRAAELQAFRSNLIAVEGLPEPEGSPVIHYGGDQDVEVWPLEELESASEAESPPQSRDGLWK
jgi:uncharacterized protein